MRQREFLVFLSLIFGLLACGRDLAKPSQSSLKSGCETGTSPEKCDDEALRAVEAEVIKLWNSDPLISIRHEFPCKGTGLDGTDTEVLNLSFEERYELALSDVRIGGKYVRVTFAGSAGLGAQHNTPDTIAKMDFPESTTHGSSGWLALDAPANFTVNLEGFWGKKPTYVHDSSFCGPQSAPSHGWGANPNLFKLLAGRKFIALYEAAIHSSGYGR